MPDNPPRPRGTDSAKVIQVIVTEALVGAGSDGDRCRIVRQYWTLEGDLLAEHDPTAPKTIRQGPNHARQ